MHLYNITLSRPTSVTHAIYGSFSEAKAQEIVAVRGQHVLELLRRDASGRLRVVASVDALGLIRDVKPFRLTGAHRDYVIVGSDSGRVAILQFDAKVNTFVSVHVETYGKTGCRRIVPGQYVAVDPKGRAAMVAAVEKAKLVYVLNRDNQANLTISSPLDANKSHMLTTAIAGVDVGFDNPTFAALEMDYGEADYNPDPTLAARVEKMLVFYELDLGLNHVVRKWSDAVPRTANLLVTIPGGSDGPSGVLVCSEGLLTYKRQDHKDVTAVLPVRVGADPKRGTLLVASTVYAQRKARSGEDRFVILLQSEYGDVYRVALAYDDDVVSAIRVAYYDTLPVAGSLCVMKSGFLFAAAEFGEHTLYEITGSLTKSSTGDDARDMDVVVLGGGENDDGDDDAMEDGSAAAAAAAGTRAPAFTPQPLRYLKPFFTLPSLAPITDAFVGDLQHSGTQQVYALSGQGARSALKVLRHGMRVSELAHETLPSKPNGVWTVKTNVNDDFDSYIVVSFVNATVVFSVGESVEEVSDSGIQLTTQTLSVSLLGDDGLLQVHPEGLRHIRADKRINEWKPPGKLGVVKAAVNNRQVVVALEGGELVYFELDESGALSEIERRSVGQDVLCIGIAPLGEGLARSNYLAVGAVDNTVRLYSLDPSQRFSMLSTQATPARPSSLCVTPLATGRDEQSSLYLCIGLANGVMLRSRVDEVSGELSDTRTRFLGTMPVRLFPVSAGGHRGVLALSSKGWLCYTFQNRIHTTPLSYDALDYASSFAPEGYHDGIVGIRDNTLRVLIVDQLGETFHQTDYALTYTPRRMVVHPRTGMIVVAETEHNVEALTPHVERVRADAKKAHADDGGSAADATGAAAEEDTLPAAASCLNAPAERLCSARRPGVGQWASLLRVVDPATGTRSVLELDDNEAALCMTTCVFHDRGGEVFLLVGTAKDLTFSPRTLTAGYIHVYKFIQDGVALQLVHKTKVSEVPYAMHPFQGRVLIGVGRVLRIYDLGKSRLLRKCENKHFPTYITSLSCQGNRIYVGDIAESVHMVHYKRSDNQLYIFADDVVPRWLSARTVLDYDTVCGGDKFGNVFVLQLPAIASREVDNDPTSAKVRHSATKMGGAANKLETLTNFFAGEMPTWMSKVRLGPGNAEVVLYTTIEGSIKALVPFTSKEDVDFYTHLEMHLRAAEVSVVGRDHLSFRSFYNPVKNTVDGDLCEMYGSLSSDEQRDIAEELDRTPGEVMKKLEDLRNRIL